MRLVDLYRSSGLGRSEFCRSHGLSSSTLNRHLKKPRKYCESGSDGVQRSRLVAVEVVTPVSVDVAKEFPSTLTVLLSNRRRVKVGRGFDAETLAQLVTVLERL